MEHSLFRIANAEILEENEFFSPIERNIYRE